MSDNLPILFTRVVVLGSTGFLGKRVCELLHQCGETVIGLSSKDLDLRQEASIAALQKLAGEDAAVVVSSALTPDRGQTLVTLADNLAMTINVGKFLESSTIGLCVNISSDAVYPLSANPISEESPIDPAGHYGLAKYASERILERAAAASSSPFLNLRVTALYGPGDTHGSYGPNSFIRSLLRERTVRIFGEGEEKRDHLHVDDAAQLIHHLIARRATGTYNLATGSSVAFRDIVDLLQCIVPVPFKVIPQPRRTPVTHRHFDVARLACAVPGFRYVPLDEGLRSYYAAVAACPS